MREDAAANSSGAAGRQGLPVPRTSCTGCLWPSLESQTSCRQTTPGTSGSFSSTSLPCVSASPKRSHLSHRPATRRMERKTGISSCSPAPTFLTQRVSEYTTLLGAKNPFLPLSFHFTMAMESHNEAKNTISTGMMQASLCLHAGLGFGASGSPSSSSNWVPDSDCLNCAACSEPFSWRKRRHHCRTCGQVHTLPPYLCSLSSL